MKEKAVIFYMENSNNIAQSILKKLKKLNLEVTEGKYEKVIFKNGEVMFTAKTSVREKEVYIISSFTKKIHSELFDILVFTDAIKRASAKRITLVSTFLPYSRQDRKASGRQPITSRLLADLFLSAGINKLITFDLHAPQVQGFYNVPVDDLRVTKVLIELIKKNISLTNLAIVSPDLGGVKRARDMASLLSLPLVILDKRRQAHNHAEILNILGDIKNKDLIIVDDMIDTAGTISSATISLKENGAKKVYVAATHGIFSGNAVEKLNNSVDGVFITNTIFQEEKINLIKNLYVADLSSFLAKVINAQIKHTPISNVYKEFSQK